MPKAKPKTCYGFPVGNHCTNPPGGKWSPYWCQSCDEKRMAHLSKQFDKLGAAMDKEASPRVSAAESCNAEHPTKRQVYCQLPPGHYASHRYEDNHVICYWLALRAKKPLLRVER